MVLGLPQHPYGGVQLSIILALEELMSSSGLFVHCTQEVGAQTHMQAKTLTCIRIKKISENGSGAKLVFTGLSSHRKYWGTGDMNG